MNSRADEILKTLAEKELGEGTDEPTIFRAFDVVQRENLDNKFDLDDYSLLSIVRECALARSKELGETREGRADQAITNISAAIEKLHRNLTDEKRGD